MIGSISSGTMRKEDLIPEFWHTYRELAPQTEWRKMQKSYRSVLIDYNLSGEQSDYCLEELFDRLNEYAPPYVYFGAHEGDGADYGFWIDWDSIDNAVADGEIVKLSDLPDFANTNEDVWQGAEYALVVNDHGNSTLYDRSGKEIWGV